MKQVSKISPDLMFEELVMRFQTYSKDSEVDILKRAYKVSLDAHKDQIRSSGDPYITHPLSVALILTDLKADIATLCTALMHDVIEDTQIKREDLLEMFSIDIVDMIEGVTKLNKLKMMKAEEEQAENFRKFLLALSKDIRILLVKLADRLHNMRTIEYISKKEKQIRIAQESLDIYVPLAERIGLFQIKDELEDACFGVLEPKVKDTIATRITYLKETFGVEIQKNLAQLNNIFLDRGIEARVLGRIKRPYSVWKKMQKRHISFQHLADIFAYRVIVDNEVDCYKVLGILHITYRFINGRFKDYISTPKQNGYQSIHTGIIGPNSVRIEVQIRTKKMHDFAENGVAAHWMYKQNINNSDNMANQYLWLKNLLSVADSTQNAKEFYENSKLNMFTDVVFVFTPRGRLIELPIDATALDFAYSIHSTVGHTAVSAKVNDVEVPLSYTLKSGDQVEIITNENSSPSVEWLDFVVTGSARTAINRVIRQKQEKDLISIGMVTLKNVLASRGHVLNSDIINVFLVKLNIDKEETLYNEIASNKIKISQIHFIITRYLKIGRYRRIYIKILEYFKKPNSFIAFDDTIKSGTIVRAKCCLPVPGDKIIGVLLKDGSRVEAHDSSCVVLQKVKATRIAIDWDLMANKEYTTKLEILLKNNSGAVSNIINILSKHGIRVLSLDSITSQSNYSKLQMSVGVKNLANLKAAMQEIKSLYNISSIHRYIDNS